MRCLRSLLLRTISLLAAAGLLCACQAAQAQREARPRPFHYAGAPKNVPHHVQTAAYLWTPGLTSGQQRFAPYLTWAYPLFRNFQAVHDAGIKTVLYVNPLMPVPDNRVEFPEVQNAQRHLQATDCNGNPVRSYGGTGYLLDVHSNRARAFVRMVVQKAVDSVRDDNGGSAPVNLLFVDNADSFYGVSPLPCGYNAASWTQAMDNALAAARYPLVINSLSVRASQIPEKVDGLRGRNVSGEMYEHCFSDGQWDAEEIAQIDAVAMLRRLHKPAGAGFWCYLNGAPSNADASTVTAQRLFAYASFLLTYDPKYSVYQTAYHSPPSQFDVLPETRFVPLDPQSAVSDLDDLRDAGGAYVRQYHYCYYAGRKLGGCEIAVNPGSGNVPVPNASAYPQSMVLQGNGVLDGGRVEFNGGAVHDLPAQSAAILVN